MTDEKTNKVGRALAALTAWSDAVTAAAGSAGVVQTTTPIAAPLVRRSADRDTATALLTAHVAELDRLWVGLTNKAMQQDDPYMADLLMRLALKVQAQLVRTVQAASEPRTIPAWPDDATSKT